MHKFFHALLFASAIATTSCQLSENKVSIPDDQKRAESDESKVTINEKILPYLELEKVTKSLALKCRQSTVGLMPKGVSGMGSGVIVSEEGLILTAAHVTRKAGNDITVFMPDGRRLKAKSLGLDYNSDAGLAKIINTNNEKFSYAEMGESANLKKGQFCLALGHAGGVLKNRDAPLRLGRILYNGKGLKMADNMITDATVISGDSGGPLFDLNGKVIGINSSIGSNYSINKHVPIDIFKTNWDKFLKNEALGKFVDYSKTKKKDELASQFGKLFQQKIKEKDPDALKFFAIAKKNGGRLTLTQDQQKTLIQKWTSKKTQTAKKKKASDKTFNLDTKKMDPKLLAEIKKYSKKGADGKLKLDVNANNIDKVRPLLKKLGIKHNFPAVVKKKIDAETYGKGAADFLSEFNSQSKNIEKSTAIVLKDGKSVALGTVISSNGYILTKASEVYLGELTCKIGNKLYPAEFLKSNNLYDLALLKVDGVDLTPVKWGQSSMPLGSWLLSPNEKGNIAALGIISHDSRRVERKSVTVLTNTNKVFLGVILNHKENSPEIMEIVEGGSAQDAGILVGDKILAINDKILTTSHEVVEEIGRYKADDIIDIKIFRNGEELIIRSKLAPRKVQVDELRKVNLEKLSLKGGSISKRNSAFPKVFTHDGIIQAKQCGGPVLNLHGEVIGLNIARVDRTTTYAIPSDIVKELILDLIK